jgi:hypothetical protein
MTEENQFTAKIIDDDYIQESEAVETQNTEEEEIIDNTEISTEENESIEELPVEDKVLENTEVEEDIKIEAPEEKVVAEEVLPTEFSKFLEYNKDTGRGMADYLEATKDLSEVSEEVKLEKYLREQNPDFDDDDIRYELEQLIVDEEYDSEKEQRDKKREKKKLLSEATKFLESNREKYLAPLESNANASVPEDYEEIKKSYQEREVEQKKIEQLNAEVREHFVMETEKLFSGEFKGFEFDLGEVKQSYIPTDVQGLKNIQSDVSNFITRHVDDSGRIKNAAEYHKALTMAMNPDAMAKYFYEQGKAEAITQVRKDSKNIDMNPRTTGDSSKPTSGFSFKLSD